MKRVKEIMTSEVEALDPAETVQSAAQKMKTRDFGLLPVCENGRVVGMLTDRDITLRVTAEGRDAGRTAVREVMTREVVCGTDTQDVQQAADLMRQNKVRRLPIVDRQRKLVGMISLGKLAKTEDEKLTGEVLRGIVQPPAR